MRALRPSRAVVRVVVSVAALYALALQAVLGGVLSAGLAGPEHRLCLEAIDTVGGTPAKDAPDKDAPAKGAPAHDHLACCTAAPHGVPFSAPVPPATAVAWPERHSIGVTWRPEIVAAPRAPPGIRPSARAPPVV